MPAHGVGVLSAAQQRASVVQGAEQALQHRPRPCLHASGPSPSPAQAQEPASQTAARGHWIALLVRWVAGAPWQQSVHRLQLQRPPRLLQPQTPLSQCLQLPAHQPRAAARPRPTWRQSASVQMTTAARCAALLARTSMRRTRAGCQAQQHARVQVALPPCHWMDSHAVAHTVAPTWQRARWSTAHAAACGIGIGSGTGVSSGSSRASSSGRRRHGSHLKVKYSNSPSCKTARNCSGLHAMAGGQQLRVYVSRLPSRPANIVWHG